MGLVELLSEKRNLVSLLTAVGVAATVFSIAIPFLERDQLKSRMKSVSLEREQIRARERAKQSEKKAALRTEPKAYMKHLVERLQLRKGLADEKTADTLRQAGMRGQAPMTVFLFARFAAPFGCFAMAILFLFVLFEWEMDSGMRFAIAVLAAGIGLYLPNLYIKNLISKRQESIRRAWPDCLDLLLICVESGMAVEPAFRRVADEIGMQSIPLAEEMSLTSAELSYLQERRKAYENLANRIGLESVRGVVTALVQAEKYGTPLGNALRVLSQESRDARMAEAEKKAAALPPKLTVPMIVFFLPVLFGVILGPGMITAFGWD